MDNGHRSPIDVQGLINFQDFTLRELFDYSQNKTISRISGHQYRMDGTFGFVGYKDVRYTIVYLVFKSPSEHLIEGERMPIELKIVTKNMAGEHLTIAIMFKIDEEFNMMMQSLGFGKSIMAKLENSNYMDWQKHRFKDIAVTLKPFLLNECSWVMYECLGLWVPCSNTTWLISVDLVTVTEQRFPNFTLDARPDFTVKTIGKRTICHNSLHSKDPNFNGLQHMQEADNVRMREAVKKKEKEEPQAK